MLSQITEQKLVEQQYKDLEDISESASKEFTIEKILSKMDADWSSVQAELKPWKDTGTHIMSGTTVDEV